MKASVVTSFLRRLSVPIWWLMLAVAASLIVRTTISLLVLQPQPTNYSLDEATYAGLAELAASGRPQSEWGSEWWILLYPSVRAFVYPASILVDLGIDPIRAVRAVSILYLAGTQALFVGVLWVWRRSLPSIDASNRLSVRSWSFVAFSVLLLLPSFSLWGSLGLKDSASAFWSIAAVFALSVCWVEQGTLRAWLSGIALGACIVSLYMVRDTLAGVLAVSIVIGVLISLRRNKVVRGALIVTGVCIAALGGLFVSKPDSSGAESRLTSSGEESSFVSSGPESARNPLGGGPRPRDCAVLKPQSITGSLDAALDCGAPTRATMAVDAETAYPNRCQEASSRGERVVCEIQSLPVALQRVLIRPLPVLDAGAIDKPAQTFAAVENLVWLSLLVALIWNGVTWRRGVGIAAYTALAYAAFIAVGLAFLQGNAGTAFRHKGQLLWPILLFMALAGVRRFHGVQWRLWRRTDMLHGSSLAAASRDRESSVKAPRAPRSPKVERGEGQ